MQDAFYLFNLAHNLVTSVAYFGEQFSKGG